MTYSCITSWRLNKGSSTVNEQPPYASESIWWLVPLCYYCTSPSLDIQTGIMYRLKTVLPKEVLYKTLIPSYIHYGRLV